MQALNFVYSRHKSRDARFLVAVLAAVSAYLVLTNYFSWPRWVATGFDPAYPYLFNAMDWYNGERVFQYNHPGATLQWTGLFVIAFFDFTGIRSADFFLENLDYYFAALSLLHAVGFLLSLSVGFLLVRKVLSDVEKVVFMSGMVLSTNLNEIVYHAPEAMLIMVSPAFAGMLLRFARDPQTKTSFAVYAGMMAAALLATKFTAVFLVTALVFVLPPKKWWIAGLSFTIMFIGLLYPIWDYLLITVQNLFQMVAQPGFGYGAEQSVKIRTAGELASFALTGLLFDKAWLFVSAGCTVWVIFQRPQLRFFKNPAFLGLFLLLIAAFSAMVYKEVFRYFVAAKFLAPVMLLVVAGYRSKTDPSQLWVRRTLMGVIGISGVFLVFNQIRQGNRMQETAVFSEEVDAFIQTHPKAALIRQFSSSSKEFAVFWGSFYSEGHYILTKSTFYLMPCTGKYLSDFTRWSLYDWREEAVSVEQLFEGPYEQVFLIGTRTATSTPFWADNKTVTFNAVLTHGDEVLYKLVRNEAVEAP